jgi:DNA-binding MarR family transcriptional regulator/GNAT superfamily N-acetyltransferase
MTTTNISERVEVVRHFNRFYTRQIGVVTEQYLSSPFSVTEARVIYELAHRQPTTASEIGAELGLDAGYLSRILRDFKKRDLIAKQSSEIDSRKSILQLSEKGRDAFTLLNTRSQSAIEAMLNKVSPDNQNRLTRAMHTIEELLGTKPVKNVVSILRAPQPGDMGWVVQRHGVLYAEEYGWDVQFEALVADIVARYIQNNDPQKEHCWIAEKDGENIGSVFLVKKSDSIAKLRLLLVEPKARGLGVGTCLVEECIRFARQTGYKKITLWTNRVLVAARQIYKKTGFCLVEEEPHHSFGHDLIGETWELNL